ncbi:MAG: NINE protein, partial [Alphaproteobacteria bacterium]|nr:NINE protein [Alphaproteobacteria bacterium]
MSNFDDLEKLASLKETGVLSKEEFQTQKEILLKKTAAPTQQKELSSYLLLAYFLGVFAAHNFYIGKTTKGVVQLLLT